MHGHAADAPAISRQQLFHHDTVALPYLLLTQRPLQLLKHPEKPKRSIRSLGSRERTRKHTVPASAHDRIEHIQAILRASLLQRDAGQRYERLTSDLPIPGIPGQHLGPPVPAADDELPGRVAQAAQKIDLAAAGAQSLRKHSADGRRIGNGFDGRRENHALPPTETEFEITRRKQILISLVSSLDLSGVFEIIVPVGSRHELRIPAIGLQVQPGKIGIQPTLHPARNRPGTSVGLHIGMRERMFVPEGEERPEPKPDVGRRLQQRIADHQLRAVVYPEQLFPQHDASHAVGDRRCRRIFEIGDVLMPPRFVGSRKTVQRQIEGLPVVHDGFIHRREQHVSAVAVVDRCHHQTMVLARVAANDGRAHIAASAIRSQHFALQRILQISQFLLIKCKYRHNCLFFMFISDRAERLNQPVLLPDPSNRLFLFPVGRIVKSPVFRTILA